MPAAKLILIKMSNAGRKPTVSDEEILRAVRVHPEPVITAKDIVEQIELTRQGVHNRLEDLVEEGYLKRKEVGSRAVVYWLSDKGKERAAATD
jgi:predicted transcriptional regulator